MINIKVVFVLKRGKEIRRFRISTFEELQAKVLQVVSYVKDTSELVLKYLDDEKDWIVFSSSDEFVECKKTQGTEKLLKMKVVQKGINESESKPDGCCYFKSSSEQNPRFCFKKSVPRRCMFTGLGGGRRGGCGFGGLGRGGRCGPFGGFFGKSPKRFGGFCKQFGGRQINKNIVCDGCEKKDFVGARWKCQTCEKFPGYDLCSDCFPKRKFLHKKGHKFDKVEGKGCYKFDFGPVEVEVVHERKESKCEPLKKEKEKVEEKKTEEVVEIEKPERKEMKEEEVVYPSPPTEDKEEEKEEEFKFPVQLSVLKQMGFKANEKLMKFLLTSNKGNVQEVANLLLNL